MVKAAIGGLKEDVGWGQKEGLRRGGLGQMGAGLARGILGLIKSSFVTSEADSELKKSPQLSTPLSLLSSHHPVFTGNRGGRVGNSGSGPTGLQGWGQGRVQATIFCDGRSL